MHKTLFAEKIPWAFVADTFPLAGRLAVSSVMLCSLRSFDHREDIASSFTFRAASQISAARRPVPAVPHDVEIGELVWEHSACIVAFGCAPYCGFCRRCLVRAAECMYVHGISRV